MQIEYVDSASLLPNPWNPNEVSPLNQEKLVKSLKENDVFKPVIVRTLDNNTLEILGGEHRSKALGVLNKKVPIVNLGKISDSKAKKISMLDNSQYGEQNDEKFIDLFNSGDLGSIDDYTSILPCDKEEITNIFDHSTFDYEEFEDFTDVDDDIDLDISKDSSNARTHQIIRFKVSLQDSHVVTDLVEKIKEQNGYTDDDELTNAGDALVHIFKELLA